MLPSQWQSASLSRASKIASFADIYSLAPAHSPLSFSPLKPVVDTPLLLLVLSLVLTVASFYFSTTSLSTATPSCFYNMPGLVSDATRILEQNVFWPIGSQCGVWDSKTKGVDVWECIRPRTSLHCLILTVATTPLTISLFSPQILRLPVQHHLTRDTGGMSLVGDTHPSTP